MLGTRLFGKKIAKEAGKTRLLHATSKRTFLVRSLADVVRDGKVVPTENGENRRYLLRGDGCGFSLQQEVFKKGSARLDFRNHVYAVMVTRGNAKIRVLDGAGHVTVNDSPEHEVAEGSMFALNAAEVAELTVESDELHVVSVMNPPLVGAETRHENGVFPVVDHDGVEKEMYDHETARRLFEPPTSLKGGSTMKDDPLF